MNILILHGWGLSGSVYKDLASELKKHGFRIYRPDLPGFGKEKISEKPRGLGDYVDFILHYVKLNGLNHFTVIGHSFGGRIAIKLAANYPQLIDRLILTGVPGFRGKSCLKIFTFNILAKGGKLVVGIFRVSKLGYYMRKILYRLASTTDYYKAKGAMRETFKKIIDEDLVSSMRRVQCPTLLLWGKEDKITPVWMAEKMVKEIKGAKLMVVSGENHKFPYQNPKLFTRKIIGLLHFN